MIADSLKQKNAQNLANIQKPVNVTFVRNEVVGIVCDCKCFELEQSQLSSFVLCSIRFFGVLFGQLIEGIDCQK